MNNTVISNNAWDTLSLPEKTEMMKVAVRNGIYNLKDIRDKYNKFAGGGRKRRQESISNAATQQAMKYFMGKGLTDYQAAGLVGNLFRESRLNPTAVNSGSGAYGIAQWLGNRKKNLFAKYGNNPSLSQQLDYVWHELNNTHKTGLSKLMSSRDSAEAARNAMGYYEFSAGPDAAIREMRRWGQNGERSMQEGINFASQLSGKPIVPYRTENSQWETIPFAPSNPEVFFNPASSYTPPTVEVEQPILKAAEDYAYNEQQERKDNLERFNMFMGMLNPSSNNDGFTDTVGLLSFGNRFDEGGPKKSVTKNDLRRMLQRNRAEAEAAYNSSIAETRITPNDNAWVDKPLTRRKKNPHTERRAVEGAKADAAWRQEHPVTTAIGAGLSTAPLAIAATPAVVSGKPYIDAGLTSVFAGHGLNKLVNGEIENTADAAMTALELIPLGRLAKPVFKETATAVENYMYPFGRPQVPEGYLTFKPQIRTRIGDIEIDNPNLLYHLDRGNRAGAFSNHGAYVEDGYLFPGTPKDASATPYSWWNKGKPYATHVGETPMTRLMTASEDTPGMLHVRSQNYPIGQWNGKRGFVLNSEYVNPEGVNVASSMYNWRPGYGWKKATDKPSSLTWGKARTLMQYNDTNSPYQNLGIFTWNRTGKAGDPSIIVKSNMFDGFVGEGSEQTVFDSLRNPDEVLKVNTDSGFSTVDGIRNFHRNSSWMRRNQVPYQERISIRGFLTNPESNTIYPVYGQEKMTPFVSPLQDRLSSAQKTQWEDILIPQIDAKFHSRGYTGSAQDGIFTGPLTVSDISPWNIGFNKDSQLRFIDFDVQ